MVITQRIPVDATGVPLPPDFEYLATAYGYTGADVTSIIRTKGGVTWTKTLGYTGDNLTSESAWVRT